MSPRRPPRAQDSVRTEPRGLAAIGSPAKATNPITAPITVRPQTRSTINRRIGEQLTQILAGRGSQLRLWDALTKQWGLAPAALTTVRWGLFQEALTKAKTAEDEWHAREPRHCGASERSALFKCTGRDTCGRHRQHLGAWMDIEESAATWLIEKLPQVADELLAQTEAPKKARR